MMKEKKMTVSDVLGENGGKKGVRRNARLIFKGEGLTVEADTKFERLDSKKILPFEEYEQTRGGVRVAKKMVGYSRGIPTYFQAIQNEKGKWVADMDKPITEETEKVLMDKRTGKAERKDMQKGLWFKKVAEVSIINEWLIEDEYNMWSEDNADTLLKIYEYLTENNLVGVYKFNPNGTAYNAFLIPQSVNGVHFRLMMKVARVKTNKPEISPTMVIKEAKSLERERARVERSGSISALEEV